MNSLNASPLGRIARIVKVHSHDSHSDIALHLQQLGFLPGEQVRVLHYARPGRDPLIVRVGNSTFALRKFEAACVLVEF
jgi:ferrous iron transport protein A